MKSRCAKTGCDGNLSTDTFRDMRSDGGTDMKLLKGIVADLG